MHHGGPPSCTLVTQLAVAAARESALRSVVIASADRLEPPSSEVCAELGGVRLRKVHRRKCLIERQRAWRRLRELVPLPAVEQDTYSWADYGVDLEIERLSSVE